MTPGVLAARAKSSAIMAASSGWTKSSDASPVSSSGSYPRTRVTDGLTYCKRKSASTIAVTSIEFSISARKRASLFCRAVTSSAVRSSTRRSSSSWDRETATCRRASTENVHGESHRCAFRPTTDRGLVSLEWGMPPSASSACRSSRRSRSGEYGFCKVSAWPAPSDSARAAAGSSSSSVRTRSIGSVETLGQPLRLGRRRGGDRPVPGFGQDLEEHIAHRGIALDDDDRLPAACRVDRGERTGRSELGEIHGEDRAGAQRGRDCDRATALLRDPERRREPEADAAPDALRREEGLEQMLERRLVDAAAGVLDREDGVAAVRQGRRGRRRRRSRSG